jgi:hypothetical protein
VCSVNVTCVVSLSGSAGWSFRDWLLSVHRDLAPFEGALRAMGFYDLQTLPFLNVDDCQHAHIPTGLGRLLVATTQRLNNDTGLPAMAAAGAGPGALTADGVGAAAAAAAAAAAGPRAESAAQGGNQAAIQARVIGIREAFDHAVVVASSLSADREALEAAQDKERRAYDAAGVAHGLMAGQYYKGIENDPQYKQASDAVEPFQTAYTQSLHATSFLESWQYRSFPADPTRAPEVSFKFKVGSHAKVERLPVPLTVLALCSNVWDTFKQQVL